jgi:glucan phosphoethanolaminetransferase (alkaline phosphatase superfamily)
MKISRTFEINYIYFGMIFFYLLAVHGYSIFLLKGVSIIPLFISVVMQCFWESAILLVATVLIQRYLHKSLLYIFISLLGILVLAHEADFIMIRLMGVTVWYLMELMSHEFGDNFLETIKATNISPISWGIGVALIITLFTIGLGIFHFTGKIAKKNKLSIGYKTLTILLLAPPFCMAIWDKFTVKELSYASYEQFRQFLPLKKTFFLPDQTHLPVAGILKELKEKNLISAPIVPKKRPPMFLFVIESLREDFITPEIAPNLFQFKQENVSFDVAASGANASHYSWFTIFHSQFPLRFSKQHALETKETGSRALQAMKELGYKIHVYSSAELAFYRTGESVFGKNHYLADTFNEYPHSNGGTTAQSDKQAMDALQKDLTRFRGEGHLFIIFLDATHFGYSWPREKGDRFQPIEDPINYVGAAFRRDSLEGIKNRYRNAIFYVDSLIGKFLKSKTAADATILITGDHGEEFYEHGQFLHASNLSQEQISVPLYYKFGKKTKALKEKASHISSHIDIFPTFIDSVGGDPALFGLEGESIFKPNKWPFTITARYNGGRNPYEFCLQGLNGKVVLQFPHLVGMKVSKSLIITEITSTNKELFLQETKSALSHVFHENE